MSFCPNCGTKIDDGALFCGECGTQIDAIQNTANMEETMPWEQNVSAGTEPMPWEQNASTETEPMPWEQNVSTETEAMPWEQNVSTETEAMPWEQNVNEDVDAVQYEAADNGSMESTGQSVQPDPEQSQNGPMRPSQIKKARQQGQQSGSSITIKKPNINVKDYKEKAKRLSKTQIIVIAEVLCLIAIIGIFCGIGSSKSSAQAVAKEYVQAYADQDWSKLYDLTDFPDGTYLQKDHFIECMKNVDPVAIDNFEISEVSMNSYYDTESLFGISNSDSSSTSSDIQKYYNVQYTVKGQGSSSMSLELIKQGEKSMLFFDSWKVASNDMVVDNYYITVPTGASVTIDGIALNESDQMEDQGYGMDVYRISVFNGTHKIQLALPWFQIYESEFEAYEGGDFTAYDMQLTEDGELALQTKMQEALERFYQAAVEEKDFSEVSDLFMDGYLETAEESYNYLAEDLNDSKYYTLNEVTFDDFSCEFYTSDGGINAEMNYDFDMEYTYTWTSWGSSSKKTEVETEDGSSYMSASFGYDGETYKLTSISIWSVL